MTAPAVDANIKIYLRCRPTGNATNRIHPSVENNTVRSSLKRRLERVHPAQIDVRVGPDEDERGIEVTKVKKSPLPPLRASSELYKQFSKSVPVQMRQSVRNGCSPR